MEDQVLGGTKWWRAGIEEGIPRHACKALSIGLCSGHLGAPRS